MFITKPPLPNRERSTEETCDPLLERTADLDGCRIARLQPFGGNPRFPDF
jgi:hypothetical protein